MLNLDARVQQAASESAWPALVFVSSGTGEIWHQPIGNLVRNGLTLDGDVIYAHAGDVLAGQTDPAAAAAINDLRAQFRDRSIRVIHEKGGRNPRRP